MYSIACISWCMYSLFSKALDLLQYAGSLQYSHNRLVHGRNGKDQESYRPLMICVAFKHCYPLRRLGPKYPSAEPVKSMSACPAYQMRCEHKSNTLQAIGDPDMSPAVEILKEWTLDWRVSPFINIQEQKDRNRFGPLASASPCSQVRINNEPKRGKLKSRKGR